MSFIQTGFLIACAAVTIPVLVHLLSRWQVRRIEIGTMRFLQEVVRDGAQRRKIRRWLLLCTRAVLAMLLAVLFARPFLSQSIRRDGERLRLVLIDRSASMGMAGNSGRLVDDAVGAAADRNAELGADATIQWAWFDRDVEPLPAGTSRPSASRSVIGDTNYLAALRWARDRIGADPDAIADVVVVTDLQKSGLVRDAVATDALAFPADVPVHILDVGRHAANNLALTNVAAPATRLDADQDVKIAVTVFNYGTLPFEEVPLTATAFDGQRTVRLKKSINVPGGQAVELSFDFGELEQAVWQVTVALDADDDLAFDNERFTAIEVAKPIDVLVLDSGTSGDRVAAESYYLATALQQSGRAASFDDATGVEPRTSLGRFRANVIYLEDEPVPALNVSSHPLVAVADAGAISASRLQQLENYVRSGGKLLVFAGDQCDPGALTRWQQSSLAPGQLQPPRRSGAMPFRIVSIRTGGTMLQPFEDPQRGDISRLAFNQLLPVSVSDHVKVLASFDGARPAMTEHAVDRGRVVWFLSSADTSWGNWPTSPLYLPLVQQMAADLLNLTGEGPIRSRIIGDEAIVERSRTSPEAIVRPVAYRPVADADVRPAFSQLGFVRQDNALYVVNGSVKESDPARVDAGRFAEHFDLQLADATDPLASTSVEGQSRNELWPWLAAAVFALLIAEFSLANRTSA